MKIRISLLTLLFLTSINFGYSQILYHSINLITQEGDTINKISQSKMYEGLHLITDNEKNVTSDSNYYKTGYFQNGVPIGNWLEHNPDGSFGKGKYKVSRETFSENNQWMTLTRGTGPKIGVWIYYNKDSSTAKKILHEVYNDEKHSHIKESIEIDSGQFNLIYSRKVRQKRGINRFNKVTEIKNTSAGIPIYITRKNFIRDVTINYNKNGVKKSINRCSNFYNRCVEKEYNSRGKKLSKITSKYWIKNQEGRHHEHFW